MTSIRSSAAAATESRRIEVSETRLAPLSTSILTLTLFLLTLLIGVWAAYDREAAWLRFGLIGSGLLAATVIAILGRVYGRRALALCGLGVALLAAILSLYFVLTYDWAYWDLGKAPALTRIGVWWQALRPALPVPEDLHSNVAGGGLAILLPIAVASAWQTYRWRWPIWYWGGGAVAVTVTLFALLMTISRGAWLGLILGAALSYLICRWWARPNRQNGISFDMALRISGIVLILLAAAMIALALFWPNLSGLIERLSASPTLFSRLQLWQQALDLIGDYPFTGSGLGSTMMVHTTYVMILHVGFIPHMHNLLLQIAVEQGLPAMLALLGFLALSLAAIRSRVKDRGMTPLALGALTALLTLFLHGMVDSGLYASLLVPALFLPFGFALGLRVEPPQASRVGLPAYLIRIVLLATLVLILLLPAVRSAFLADLGAVAQTRWELANYAWPDFPNQDALRRSDPAQLAPAIAYYRSALSLNPASSSANRRLGQVELSLGDYDAAHRHLQAAYRTAPRQQATRLLLGESYAIAGDIDPALNLWRTLNARFWWDDNWVGWQTLAGRQWWHEHLAQSGISDETNRAAGVAAVISQLQAERTRDRP
ncbi:MAG: O-antigen ligase family protein [Caldilineales bacterium]|nr:O-antigen ligase family protein [Caldilineales bacterium]